MRAKRHLRNFVVPFVLLLGVGALGYADGDEPRGFHGMLLSRNDSGFAATFSTSGSIDTNNPFFKSIGSNGRTCNSCHQPDQGWSVTPKAIEARFRATAGTDPIFRLNDGANSPGADVSTVAARRTAYSMLLTKGLIRVGNGVPANAEFELIAVDDPYGFASATELSLFRRPLPTANLKFLSTVMWDARETFKDALATDTCVFTPAGVATSNCFATVHFDLLHQANSATEGHAQSARPLTSAEREAIVQFQNQLFTAQVVDSRAGNLTAHGARGGPKHAVEQAFYFGINDVVSGDYRTRAPFTPVVFNLYDTWAGVGADYDEDLSVGRARRAVARGQALFNTKPIEIVGVKGLNDDLGVARLAGTCTTCHDTPNAGNHSIPAPLDIGLTDASRRTPDMPLYTLRNKTTGATIQSTDPGRALLTGKWKDIGRFKGPVLRGLAARAPYFHNGFAKTLNEAVDFYDTRFGIGLTDREKHDLVAFLKTL